MDFNEQPPFHTRAGDAFVAMDGHWEELREDEPSDDDSRSRPSTSHFVPSTVNDSCGTGFATDAYRPSFSKSRSEPGGRKSPSKKKVPGQPPRPPNAWILYRSEQFRLLKADATSGIHGKRQSEISKEIAQAWRNESASTRSAYEQQAAARKQEHNDAYLNYQVNPPGSKRNRSRSASFRRDSSSDLMVGEATPVPLLSDETRLPAPRPSSIPYRRATSFPGTSPFPTLHNLAANLGSTSSTVTAPPNLSSFERLPRPSPYSSQPPSYASTRPSSQSPQYPAFSPTNSDPYPQLSPPIWSEPNSPYRAPLALSDTTSTPIIGGLPSPYVGQHQSLGTAAPPLAVSRGQSSSYSSYDGHQHSHSWALPDQTGAPSSSHIPQRAPTSIDWPQNHYRNNSHRPLETAPSYVEGETWRSQGVYSQSVLTTSDWGPRYATYQPSTERQAWNNDSYHEGDGAEWNQYSEAVLSGSVGGYEYAMSTYSPEPSKSNQSPSWENRQSDSYMEDDWNSTR